jgi:hypothetical protein
LIVARLLVAGGFLAPAFIRRDDATGFGLAGDVGGRPSAAATAATVGFRELRALLVVVRHRSASLQVRRVGDRRQRPNSGLVLGVRIVGGPVGRPGARLGTRVTRTFRASLFLGFLGGVVVTFLSHPNLH